MNKSDEFVESRIRWRAELHKVPYPETYYWEGAPSELKIDLNLEVGKPVLVSTHDENCFVVLCTRGLIVNDNDVALSMHYVDIESIGDSDPKNGKEKSDIDRLKLNLRDGKILTVKTEKGAACFCIWNILLMLIKLK